MEYFGRAKTATEATKIASAREEIELEILNEILRANSENNEFNYNNVWNELEKKDKDMSVTENEAENNYTVVYKGYNFLVDNRIVTHVEGPIDPSQTTSELTPLGEVTIDGVTYTQSYNIWNKGQLETFRDKVNAGDTFENCIIRQKANINLNNENWEPIGDSTNTTVFSGTFDAEGKTTRGININREICCQGLFGHIKNGIVKNLTVEGRVVGSSGSAGIIGLIEGGKVEGCINKAIISNNYGYASWNTMYKNSIIIGGVSGIISGTTQIINCSNNGMIECNVGNCDTITAGGIAGVINESGINSNIESCSNSAEIKVASTTPNTVATPILGGIIGIIYEGKISKCNNTGKIYSIETNDITTYNASGGIAGTCLNVNNNNSKKIEKCWNKGEIENSIAGGIVGLCNYYLVDNCYNAGKIKSNYKCGINSSALPCGGGICASSSGTIQNCYNKGEVENNGCGFAASNTNIGTAAGIAGGNHLGNVVNCYNKGTIKSLPSAEDQRGSIAGGVIGTNYGNISNTYNEGSIITNGNSNVTIGGVVAWEYPQSTTRYINYVYNIGKLNEEQSQNENNVVRGGVLGDSSSNGAIWTNFYWLEGTGAIHSLGKATVEDPTKYTSEQIKSLISSGSLPDTDWATDSNINNGYPHLKVFDDTNIWLRDSKNDGDPYLKENLPQ